MTITIQQSMLDTKSLSDKSQLILKLIPNGLTWIDLSTSQLAPHYTFQSESDLILAVLDGLHNTKLLFIPSLELCLDPEKLYAMTTAELTYIVDAASGGNIEQAIEVCDTYNLQSNTQLNSVTQKMLSKCGVKSNSLFEAMSISDLLSLDAQFSRMPKTPNTTILKEASSLALESAQTPRDFADLMSFNLVVVDKLDITDNDVASRNKAIWQVMQALNPFAMELLNCPQLSGSTAEDEITQAVSTWLDYGNSIGFCSNARALLQLAQNLELTQLQESVIAKATADYVGKTQMFLRSAIIQPPVLLQDGTCLTYAVESSNPSTQLSLDPHGCLTLDYMTFH
ncbi:hypothetical protein [Arenicella xantha]|uniref:Uncharacterized protein n=1 Tax=Arenicella xantha TaxID=644221 RepID=A0A395JU88_9GAMM|nr:hypothetical protein [Arenicella xantha]RBP53108.1 hypothetical protein DFR28_101493 [Arenicella xantha]